MKLELEMTLTEFDHVLSGYTALLNLRLMNLCVKAEAAALLAVEVPFKGEKKRIEDVAKVAIPTGSIVVSMPASRLQRHNSTLQNNATCCV